MITSLQKVRDRIRLTELEVQYDMLLTDQIILTLDRFNCETGRQLQRTVNHVQEFDAGDLEVSLECYPVESISKWELWMDGAWQEQTNLLPVVRRGGIVLLGHRLGSRGGLARVTYTGGYVLPDPPGGQGMYLLPPIIEIAAIETVMFWWQSKEAVGLIRVEGLGGDYKEQADTEWVPWVRTTLKKFRRMGV